MNYNEFRADFNACPKKARISISIVSAVMSIPKFPIELIVITMSAVYTAVVALTSAIGCLCLRAILRTEAKYSDLLKACIKEATESNFCCKPFIGFIGLFK